MGSLLLQHLSLTLLEAVTVLSHLLFSVYLLNLLTYVSLRKSHRQIGDLVFWLRQDRLTLEWKELRVLELASCLKYPFGPREMCFLL